MIHIHAISIAVLWVAAFVSGYLLRLIIDRLAKRRKESEDHVFAGWVARNRNGALYFHEMRPVKNKRTGTWGSSGMQIKLRFDKFNVEWEDEEPMKVMFKKMED